MAVGIATAEFALLVGTCTLAVLGSHATRPGSVGPGAGAIIVQAIPSISFAIVGTILVARRPNNRMGWLCLLVGGAQLVSTFQLSYAAYGATGPGGLPGAAMVGAWTSWVPGVGLLGTFFLLLFPDGHLPSPRWRPLAWAAAATLVLLHFAVVFSSRTVAFFTGTHNPVLPHGTALRFATVAFNVLMVLLVAEIVASVASLFLRYRRATVERRAQLKWMAYAGASFFVLFVISSIAWQDHAPHPGLFISAVQDMSGVALGLIPPAVLVAILRYRLYDIDRLISRTLSYGVVSAIVAAIYALVVVMPTTLLGGGRTPAPLVAGGVLIAALVFRPVLQRVQQHVDARFDRARADTAATFEAFALRLREQIDIDTLTEELRDVVQRTLHPAHSSIWTTPVPREPT